MADQPTDRIAEVLREHRYLSLKGTGECSCGYECFTHEHPAHVAEAVVSALELTEERRLDSWWGGSAHSVVRVVGPWRTA